MSFSTYLQDLDPEQKEAVEHGDGPLLVFAGAGSGKTRVLTRRIAKLILDHEIHPSRIFAVTFTNKAAQEMKSRVRGLLENYQHREAPIWISTFHASCARILRAHAEALDCSAVTGHDFGVEDLVIAEATPTPVGEESPTAHCLVRGHVGERTVQR